MARTIAEQVYNFCSGPAMLPEPVMAQAQAELNDYQGRGVSIMEMSHRSDEFLAILASAQHRLRSLLNIPSNYRVLFMQGGASLQFSAVPLNLSAPGRKAGFLQTGYWSEKAIAEAGKFTAVDVVASSQSLGYKAALRNGDYRVPQDLAYIHYTPNETIDGNAFADVPDVGEVPLVADMSSCILSEPVDVSRFGVIYAGAQKNIGPAGLTVVIVREDLLGKVQSNAPALLNYQHLVNNDSMANTPPTFAIYLADLVFQWLQQRGGLVQVEQDNKRKAMLLYQAIDDSALFSNDVQSEFRSMMNVPFSLQDSSDESSFIDLCQRNGLLSLQGHRSRGGFRASIYNAMPYQGVARLVELIQLFEKQYV